MIKPTVGRKVWYRPSPEDIAGTAQGDKMEVNGTEPLDATVVAVWSDRLVNLAIFDIYAKVHERRSVTLLQEGDALPQFYGRYAEWMPYQTGQAKKTEYAEAVAGMIKTPA
jgi:hypothetical protein